MIFLYPCQKDQLILQPSPRQMIGRLPESSFKNYGERRVIGFFLFVTPLVLPSFRLSLMMRDYFFLGFFFFLDSHLDSKLLPLLFDNVLLLLKQSFLLILTSSHSELKGQVVIIIFIRDIVEGVSPLLLLRVLASSALDLLEVKHSIDARQGLILLLSFQSSNFFLLLHLDSSCLLCLLLLFSWLRSLILDL